MSEIFYKKIGRRYHPVSYYDHEVLDSLPKGHHLLSIDINGNNWSAQRHCINSDHAGLLAALMDHRETIMPMVIEAIEYKRKFNKDEQAQKRHRKAWKAYCEIMGDDAAFVMESASAFGVYESLIKAVLTAVDGDKK